MVTITFDKAYMVPFGLLKCVEFLTILIGWAIWAEAAGTYCYGMFCTSNSRIQYFVAIGVISWLFVIVWFALNVLKITNKMSLNPKNIWFAVFHFVLGFLLIIGAGLIAAYGGSSRGDAGIAFGFVGSFVLIFDGVIHLVSIGKNYYGGATVTTTTTSTTTTVTTK